MQIGQATLKKCIENPKKPHKKVIITPDEKIDMSADQAYLIVCPKIDCDPGFDGPLISALRRGPRKHKPHLLRFVNLLIKEYIRIGQPSENELATPDVVSERCGGNLCRFVFSFTHSSSAGRILLPFN